MIVCGDGHKAPICSSPTETETIFGMRVRLANPLLRANQLHRNTANMRLKVSSNLGSLYLSSKVQLIQSSASRFHYRDHRDSPRHRQRCWVRRRQCILCLGCPGLFVFHRQTRHLTCHDTIRTRTRCLPGHAAHSPVSLICTSPEGWWYPKNLPGTIGTGSFKLLMCVTCRLEST